MLKVRLLIWLIVVSTAAWSLPWWATALIGVLGPAWVFQPWRRSMEDGVARSRGFPLRDAFVQIERLTSEAIDARTLRVRLEILLRPRAGNARLRPWWPDEFRFVPNVGAVVRAESCELKSGQDWKAGIQTTTGEQYVRFSVEVPATAKNLTLRYFREELAHIELGNEPTPGKVPVG